MANKVTYTTSEEFKVMMHNMSYLGRLMGEAYFEQLSKNSDKLAAIAPGLKPDEDDR